MRRLFNAGFRLVLWIAIGTAACANPSHAASPARVDFNRDIRAILSNNCYTCHGPDAGERQAGLRLDTQRGSRAAADSGAPAIVPGEPDNSELLRRLLSQDLDERMPPADSGRPLTEREIDLLTTWIRQGAAYADHWSYIKPVRPQLPDVAGLLRSSANLTNDQLELAAWPRNEIDHFILARLVSEGIAPAPQADRYALIRRVTLDLTGLPPTLQEVQRFVDDADPRAYEILVDRLLAKDSYGEHWARMWLDLARFADSAGYADDPPRTIWAFRDWVLRALNANQPFDQFAIEQIAGDLLPDPTDDQLVATAFHRNTLTNNEGGTDDEEFRNVAIVDRVNTTMAVWMGTTINCCQCHDHKYDPISQEEYYRLFAIFNNTADADRRDESPLVKVVSAERRQQMDAWRAEIARLKEMLAAKPLTGEQTWHALKPNRVQLQSGGGAVIAEDGRVLVTPSDSQDVYTVDLPLDQVITKLPQPAKGPPQGSPPVWTAVQLETIPHDSLPHGGAGYGGGNFVITRVLASLVPPQVSRREARYVRIELPGIGQILSLAEVQVFCGVVNLATDGVATQSSTAYEGLPGWAIDGNTDGNFNAQSTTHTETETDPWWEVDLGAQHPIDRLVLWNRTDGGLQNRLAHFRVVLLDQERRPVWQQTVVEAPDPSSTFSVSGVRAVKLAVAWADFAQAGFDPDNVLRSTDPNRAGWAVAPRQGRAHKLILIPASPVDVPAGATLRLTIEQRSAHANHTLGHFRVALSGSHLATTLASLSMQLAESKPYITVPVMRELPPDQRRTTHIQHRGNFLDLGKEVSPGVPEVFHPLPTDVAADRLALARWLVNEDNPLTARVIANRYWEAIFGRGIVATSEEFGSQGELPTHPELLDWLATELVRSGWDLKTFLRLLVTSAAYCQSSRVTPELRAYDPQNLLVARGPRFRLSAEMIRDQALAVSGLLSSKLYGPPVKPPQPQLGLTAAFGGGIDWQPSEGEDRYRRGVYTTWRRSSPYPSMAAFDAPSRDVCTIRRDRTNTPLQALVTLNDPVYVEAAQALARRMASGGETPAERARFGFRLCLARPPSAEELHELVSLYQQALARFTRAPEDARQLATVPLGSTHGELDIVDLAAWTVVGNVLLNLDEMFVKR